MSSVVGIACGLLGPRIDDTAAGPERHFAEVWVLTQNVDGFHGLAGSINLVDIHGDMRRLICTRSSCDWTGGPDEIDIQMLPPKCPRCSGVVRPDVVLFGEMLP